MRSTLVSVSLVVICALTSRAALAQTNCSSVRVGEVFPAGAESSIFIGQQLALSKDGRRIALGQAAFSHLNVPSGAVWIVDAALGSTQTETQLVPAPLSITRNFGSALAMSAASDVLAVGAPGGTSGFLGRVFVFRFDGLAWIQEWQAIGVANDQFGQAVALSADGDTLVVGAPLRDLVTDFGAFMTYRRVSGVWTLQSTVTSLTLPMSTRIGNVLALSPDGNTLAVRSFGWFTGESGAIHVLERNGASWAPVARLIEPVSYSNGGFASVIDMSADGRTLVAGNYVDSRIAYSQGAVTTFRLGSSGWAYDSVLLPNPPTLGAGFGLRLAMNEAGDRLWVGAPGQELNGESVGSVEEFELVGSAWTRTSTHFSPQPKYGSAFGLSVASSATGRTWLAGEMACDNYGPDAGRVLVYDAPCLTPTAYCTAQTNTLGCAAQIGAQGTPSLSSPSGFVVAASNVRNQQNGMLIYGASGRASLPWLGGTLCVQPPLRRTPLVNSGGSAQPTNDCSGTLSRDFNAWAFTATDPLLFAGQHVRAQFYSRDPGASHNQNLSDAVEFYLEP